MEVRHSSGEGGRHTDDYTDNTAFFLTEDSPGQVRILCTRLVAAKVWIARAASGAVPESLGLAGPVLSRDGIGTQERAVKAHPLQGRLDQRAQDPLAKAPQPAVQAVHADALGIGQFLHGVDTRG